MSEKEWVEMQPWLLLSDIQQGYVWVDTPENMSVDIRGELVKGPWRATVFVSDGENPQIDYLSPEFSTVEVAKAWAEGIGHAYASGGHEAIGYMLNGGEWH